MRILHIYRTYYPECLGGLLEVIRQLCLGGKALGVESRILALSRDPGSQPAEAEEADVQWLKLSFEIAGCGFSLEALQKFRELTAWADVIHYHYPWPFADMLHMLGHPDRPSVVTYHSDIVKQGHWVHFYRPLMTRFLTSVNTIVATSPRYAATSPVLQLFRDKTRVIPIGIDPASYPSVAPERIASWRERLGDDFFLFIGVLRYYKGLQYLLEAIKDSPLKLAIVGCGLNEDELKAFAANNQLNNVHFLGSVSEEDKVALLQLCQCLVLPSHLRSEAFGVVLLEAAMFGKPQITCEIGTGTSYVNLHEETGLVVPPRDSTALKQAMERIADSPNDRSRWGENARNRFQNMFTAAHMTVKYVALYRELVEQHRESNLASYDGAEGDSVLITGGSSQVGVYLIPKLRERGLTVHALSRRPPPASTDGAFWHRANIENLDLSGAKAHTLVHLAPLPLLPPLLERLEAGEGNPAGLKRVIAFGSTSRFVKQQSGSSEERAFARALADAETAIAQFCERRGIAWTIFRPTLIYGCGRDRNVTLIANFIRRFGFFPLIGEAGGLRQPVHAEDLASACVAVIDNPQSYNRAYDLSGAEVLSYRSMVERIFAAAGKQPRFLRIPLPLFRMAMELASLLPSYRYLSGEMAKRMADNLCFDHSQACRDFAYSPRNFEPPTIGE